MGMDNSEYTFESNQRQESALNHPRKKQGAGAEIVPSADLSRRHYFRPRFKRRTVSSQSALSPHDRIVALRRDLTILRRRLQDGQPVAAACLIRLENVARSLEAEVAA